MFMSSVGKLRLQNREKKVMRYYDDLGPGKGNCTMGFGSMVHRNPCNADELETPVSEAMVEVQFSNNLRDAERAVERNVKVALNQEQFDALVSYTFNRGSRGAHNAFRLINGGDFKAAAAEISGHITATVKVKGKRVAVVLRGLIPRRAEESAPFRKEADAASRNATK